MSFLCILAAIASFVIETKTSISASGELPETATANYECTYKKGQLTDGNTATLYLSGWQNTYIHSVTLYMRSNKQSGAGSLNMTVDEQTVWKISNNEFSSSAWNGSFSDTYVPISHSFSPAITSSQGNITIQVAASANSLYIERYEIVWEKAEARPYTVTFIEDGINSYTQQTESSIGEGVLLPHLPNIDSWYFIGWSLQAISETTDCPTLFLPDTRFYPAADTRLYAVYTDYLPAEFPVTQCVNPHSGFYAIAFGITQKAFSGTLDDDQKGIHLSDITLRKTSTALYERLSPITSDMIYAIHFISDTTALIWHAQTGESIGLHNGALSDSDTEWRYRLLSDSTIAFYVPKSDTHVYTLAPTYEKQCECWLGRCVSTVDSILVNQTLLYETDYNTTITHYTSYPYGQSVFVPEQTPIKNGETIVQMGIYRFFITPKETKRLHID